MEKKIINTLNAPSPIGPYNQAIETNNIIFISGQIAIDPVSNQLVQESIEAETEQVMKNLSAILLEAELSFEHVVKTSIFLSDMKYFSAVNDIYATYFTSKYPARETVAVLGLPKNVHVEISMIAAR